MFVGPYTAKYRGVLTKDTRLTLPSECVSLSWRV